MMQHGGNKPNISIPLTSPMNEPLSSPSASPLSIMPQSSPTHGPSSLHRYGTTGLSTLSLGSSALVAGHKSGNTTISITPNGSAPSGNQRVLSLSSSSAGGPPSPVVSSPAAGSAPRHLFNTATLSARANGATGSSTTPSAAVVASAAGRSGRTPTGGSSSNGGISIATNAVPSPPSSSPLSTPSHSNSSSNHTISNSAPGASTTSSSSFRATAPPFNYQPSSTPSSTISASSSSNGTTARITSFTPNNNTNNGASTVAGTSRSSTSSSSSSLSSARTSYSSMSSSRSSTSSLMASNTGSTKRLGHDSRYTNSYSSVGSEAYTGTSSDSDDDHRRRPQHHSSGTRVGSRFSANSAPYYPRGTTTSTTTTPASSTSGHHHQHHHRGSYSSGNSVTPSSVSSTTYSVNAAPFTPGGVYTKWNHQQATQSHNTTSNGSNGHHSHAHHGHHNSNSHHTHHDTSSESDNRWAEEEHHYAQSHGHTAPTPSSTSSSSYNNTGNRRQSWNNGHHDTTSSATNTTTEEVADEWSEEIARRRGSSSGIEAQPMINAGPTTTAITGGSLANHKTAEITPASGSNGHRRSMSGLSASSGEWIPSATPGVTARIPSSVSDNEWEESSSSTNNTRPVTPVRSRPVTPSGEIRLANGTIQYLHRAGPVYHAPPVVQPSQGHAVLDDLSSSSTSSSTTTNGSGATPGSVAVGADGRTRATTQSYMMHRARQGREGLIISTTGSAVSGSSGPVTPVPAADDRISMLSLLYDPPVEGCDLRPYAAITDGKGKTTAIRVKDNGRAVFRWLRGQKRICSIPTCGRTGRIQCITCVKAKLPQPMSFFCSRTCWQQAWPLHRQAHASRLASSSSAVAAAAASPVIPTPSTPPPSSSSSSSHGTPASLTNVSALSTEEIKTLSINWDDIDEDLDPEEDDGSGNWPNPSATAATPHLARPDSPTSLARRYPPPSMNTWSEVSRSRCYTPSTEDVGRQLRLECAPVLEPRPTHRLSISGDYSSESESSSPLSRSKSSSVSSAPGGGPIIAGPGAGSTPSVTVGAGSMTLGASLSSLSSLPVIGDWVHLETSASLSAPAAPPPRTPIKLRLPAGVNTANSPFKVMCYNVLAQIYATRQIYPYCQLWALAWSFRKKCILREILLHNPDVICLQEVQANHYDKFFQPHLSKAGYDGVYKRKTREAVGDSPNAIDGCAIFFKRDRFAVMEQHHIDFNDLAMRHTRDPRALRRLMKGNIGLVVVLEELTPAGGAAASSSSSGAAGFRRPRKRKLAVCNTHIFWDPAYADVKLWQTWVLCQELEKLVMSRQLPLLLCGDFNSLLDSPVYELLATERVSSKHSVFKDESFGFLPPSTSIHHRLPLASAYAPIGEPKYTNFTGHFVGVLDYIFYTKHGLTPISCLQVDNEELLRQHVALPSPQYPSDHISLVAEMDWIVD